MISRDKLYQFCFVLCLIPFCFWPLLTSFDHSERIPTLGPLSDVDLRRNISFRDSSLACCIVTIPSALNAIISIIFTSYPCSDLMGQPEKKSSDKKFIVLSHGERLVFLIGSAILSALCLTLSSKQYEFHL